MKKFLLILLLASICQVSHASECQFDLKTRVENNLLLKKKYPGSHLIEKNLVLVVPVDEGQVEIAIGGCEHYGISVELKTKNAKKYQSENELMGLILHLAKTYSQGMVDSEILKTVIKENNWTKLQDPSRVYFLKYEGSSTFEVYAHNDGRLTVLGFNYYS
jgi:hypothetical protein